MTDEGVALLLREQFEQAERERSPLWIICGMLVGLGVSLACWTAIIYAALWAYGLLRP